MLVHAAVLASTLLVLGQADKLTSLREAFATANSDFDRAQQAWADRYNTVIELDPKAEVSRYLDWPLWEFAPRFLAISQADPDDPAAVDALLWIITQGTATQPGDRRFLAIHTLALDRISDHLDDPRIDSRLCVLVSRGLSPGVERFLHRVAAEGRDPQTRASATISLARYLVTRRKIALDPWFDKEDLTDFQKFFVTQLDPLIIDYARGGDPAALRDEAERLFEDVINRYPDVPASKDPQVRKTLADYARSELQELRTSESVLSR